MKNCHHFTFSSTIYCSICGDAFSFSLSLFTFQFSLLGFYLRFILCARFDEENETEKCWMHSSYVDSFVEWRAKTLLELLLMFAVLLVICWSVESGTREKNVLISYIFLLFVASSFGIFSWSTGKIAREKKG